MYLEHLERLHDTLETPDGDELHVWWIYAIPAGEYESRPPTDAEYEPFPARTALRQLADGLRETGSGDTVTYPFGAHIATPPGQPWHTWGLRQPPALARAGDVFGADEYVEAARNKVAALHTLHCSCEGQIAAFGPAPLPYHQFSYGRARPRLYRALARDGRRLRRVPVEPHGCTLVRARTPETTRR